jgi:hypothetical protein
MFSEPVTSRSTEGVGLLLKSARVFCAIGTPIGNESLAAPPRFSEDTTYIFARKIVYKFAQVLPSSSHG